ncbi:MAG: hypothetical protein LBG79_06290 [Spirochaetaceae bacterium]|jgi:hypothetical protein|nr:hypothetical protein [Spirochaetaceae bacterium]GMO17471.1 MAG: hypothetical protein Pg6A_03900 [Termitinemataceae bacterium]
MKKFFLLFIAVLYISCDSYNPSFEGLIEELGNEDKTKGYFNFTITFPSSSVIPGNSYLIFTEYSNNTDLLNLGNGWLSGNTSKTTFSSTGPGSDTVASKDKVFRFKPGNYKLLLCLRNPTEEFMLEENIIISPGEYSLFNKTVQTSDFQ